MTLEDFEAIRDVDDGHRYELIDGSLIVTPSPLAHHQLAVIELAYRLRLTRPEHYQVYVAPLDISLGKDTVLQPDVLVVARSDIANHRVQGAPTLAVEVLSPSTRHIDLGLKLSRYEAAGTANYWVIDPDEPSLRAWELREGRYVEVSHITGDEPADLALPWPVQIVPSQLVDDRN